MSRRIVQCLSHAIESYDMLRLHHSNGHEVVDIGAYIDPANPHVDTRPALPEVPLVPVVKAAVDALGQQGHTDTLMAAQEHLPDDVLDWADTLIFHHYLHRLYGDWPRIRDWMRGDSNRRVIWRSVGQSVDGNEHDSVPFRKEGLERVAYSPKEASIPGYSGHTALIRFGKDPSEWHGWVGDRAVVGNVTQGLKQRDDSAKGGADWTNYAFWQAATAGLPTLPAGPGSDEIGGLGALTYDELRGYLRDIRVMLYTGTQPASYTLGLIEAQMTGVPIVSIGPAHMILFPYVPDMFEGHEIAGRWSDDPSEANRMLSRLLTDDSRQAASIAGRERAIELFGIDTIKRQWSEYLR